MDQKWFEMERFRRRKVESFAWIPLHACMVVERQGSFGFPGFQEEWFGTGTLAVLVEDQSAAMRLDWSDLGAGLRHKPYVEDGRYFTADNISINDSKSGNSLVLIQTGDGLPGPVWHLHPDLILGLDLIREGDSWLSWAEGYEPAVRLRRTEEGIPCLIEIRAEHLRDYLCARQMALYSTSYRQRRVVSEDHSLIDWPEETRVVEDVNFRWEGRISEICEGGMPYGMNWSVVHAARSDVDPEDDIPQMNFPPSIDTNTWSVEHRGRKLFVLEGELWRKDILSPGAHSQRIRGDRRPSTVYFVIDADGTKLQGDELLKSGRWLWFDPAVIMRLVHRRGGQLSWFTRDTGGVSASPGPSIHFGMNDLGLINVYAKDIGGLPEWQQTIWAGHNVRPDGGVSQELLESQVRADPTSSDAPEKFLALGLVEVNEASEQSLGFPLLRSHEQTEEILARTHRFRATDRAGFWALAKDIARLTADSFNASAIHEFLELPKKNRPGSLKSVEKLIAQQVGDENARLYMGPLVGAYELRHGDAHLPGSEIEDSLQLVRADRENPFVIQGREMLRWCTGSIWQIVETLRCWDLEQTQDGSSQNVPNTAAQEPRGVKRSQGPR